MNGGRFVTLLFTLLLLVVGGTYVWASEQYAHPYPELDCQGPFPYENMCVRAQDGEPVPPPPQGVTPVLVVLVVLAAILLLILGYSASVTRQHELVTRARSHSQDRDPPHTPPAIPSNPLPPPMPERQKGGGR